EDDTLAGIAAGDIYGTVVQNPFEFGKQSVTRMEKYLHGDKTQLDGKLFIPTRNIKKDNVADYQAYKKKIIGQ
ncbi:MAG TPA: ABC transporter substrate-binding protein, partial [Verrucomicrobiae bacterium]